MIDLRGSLNGHHLVSCSIHLSSIWLTTGTCGIQGRHRFKMVRSRVYQVFNAMNQPSLQFNSLNICNALDQPQVDLQLRRYTRTREGRCKFNQELWKFSWGGSPYFPLLDFSWFLRALRNEILQAHSQARICWDDIRHGRPGSHQQCKLLIL